jgi:hypothetical protein
MLANIFKLFYTEHTQSVRVWIVSNLGTLVTLHGRTAIDYKQRIHIHNGISTICRWPTILHY